MAFDSAWGNKLLIVSIILVIIGALNWGLIGIANTNVVSSLNNVTFRSETFERIIYVLIGLAGLYLLFNIGHFW